jgi:transcriptional regulator with XRE-family HTH domain
MRNLSQQSLADLSGYHRTYIGLLERGQKSPSLRTIWNIATILQVQPSEILKRVEHLVAPIRGSEGVGYIRGAERVDKETLR